MLNFLSRVAFIVLLSLSFMTAANAVTEIDKIVVFGDSLSDNGNVYRLSTDAHDVIPKIPVIPKSPPYYEGHFTNGKVWAEVLAETLHVPLDDYAYAGAWAESTPDSGVLKPFSLGTQVDFFLVESALDFHKDKHLYFIWSGANDYMEGRDDPDYATTNTVKLIQDQIEWLIYYGAKDIAIFSIPDLGTVPAITAQGPEVVAKMRHLSDLHNQKLADMVREEQEKNPETLIVFGDASQYFNDIITNPGNYGLKNTTEACFGGGYTLNAHKLILDPTVMDAAKKARFDILHNADLRSAYETMLMADDGAKPCANPGEYLFWDHVHPTSNVHKIIASIVHKKLSEYGIVGKA